MIEEKYYLDLSEEQEKLVSEKLKPLNVVKECDTLLQFEVGGNGLEPIAFVLDINYYGNRLFRIFKSMVLQGKWYINKTSKQVFWTMDVVDLLMDD